MRKLPKIEEMHENAMNDTQKMNLMHGRDLNMMHWTNPFL